MTKKYIIANFKMNQTPTETKEYLKIFLKEINSYERNSDSPSIVLCPPATSLHVAKEMTKNSIVSIGAQNINGEEKGAFTGEISLNMIVDCNAKFCIVGHSERRTLFNETNEIVAKKLERILNKNVTAILCVGESLDSRNKGNFETVISSQIDSALKNVSKEKLENLIIAYEPIWAIGTGISANETQIAEAAYYIRKCINKLFDSQSANQISILYGGSVSEKNKQYLSIEGINGGLVGGASLNPTGFATLTNF
ncbi:MAG: triose-phosphate isomerase [Clostridia bacterium]